MIDETQYYLHKHMRAWGWTYMLGQVFGQFKHVGLEIFEHLPEQVEITHTLICPILYYIVLY
jgi:hypothetical protein